MILLALASRNATRNLVRTGLTASIVVFGTAFLILALSWTNGVFNQLTGITAAASGHVRIANGEFVRREDLMPLYENVADTKPVEDAIAALPGVKGVYPRITAGATITIGEEIGDVFGLVVGAPEGWMTEQLDLDAKMAVGRMLANDDEIVLGITLADRVGAKVGDEVVIVGQTQDGSLSPIKGTVVGIASAGNALSDQQAFVTLAKARYLVDIPDGATEVLVYGEDRGRAAGLRDAVVAALGERAAATLPPGEGPAPELLVQAWSDREPWKSFVETGAYIQGWIQGIIVFITALGVWNTMMMSVLERTGEIGVMRAMGLGRLGAVALFVVEALAIAVVGGTLGVLLGALPSYYLLELRGVSLGETVVQNMNMPFSNTMYGDFSTGVAVQGFVLAQLMALVGSALPAWHAASIQPVEAMRAKR